MGIEIYRHTYEEKKEIRNETKNAFIEYGKQMTNIISRNDNKIIIKKLLYENERYKNDIDKLKKAAKIQFSIDQPVIIYYGTEVGLSQEKSMWASRSHGDLQARRPMGWEIKDADLLGFYKNLINEKLKKVRN